MAALPPTGATGRASRCSCKVMLQKDQAMVLAEMELAETLHPADAAAAESVQP